MAYMHKNSKGESYYLHGRMVTLRGGLKLKIFYFARKPKGKDEIDMIPDGYKVVENKRTGLPMLKKAK